MKVGGRSSDVAATSARSPSAPTTPRALGNPPPNASASEPFESSVDWMSVRAFALMTPSTFSVAVSTMSPFASATATPVDVLKVAGWSNPAT
jgi:hypothetical protein